MKLPVVLVNFKTYPRGTGASAVQTARLFAAVAKRLRATVVVAVQPTELREVARSVTLPVFAQHMDPDAQGRHTGSVIAEALRDAGAQGTLLNHSEKKLRWSVLAASVDRAKKVKLKTIVCVATPAEARRVARLKPDMIAIEPPELIAGSVSVAEARPRVITAAVREVPKGIPVLCGAGVKSEEDARRALELGAQGVLLASGVMVKARKPGKTLAELIGGMK